MAVLRAGNEADYLFRVGDYSRNELKVVHFSGSEAISELFQFHVDLASTNEALDFDRIIGQPGLLTLHSPGGRRYVHGLVNLFEQTGREGRWTYYHARIVPALWLLSRRATCRIFQNKSIPDILETVLTEGGLMSDQFRFSMAKDYPPQEYCVQYRETDLVFFSRLMEQQGLFYFFEQTDDNHTLVIGDDPAVHLPIAEPAAIFYRAPGTAGVSSQEHISEYRCNREIRSGGVRLRDFDFKKPRLSLEREKKVQENGHLEVYDYPGKYLTIEEGEGLAKVRLETLRTTEQIGSGQSDCSRIASGRRFTLERHYRTDFNREYLVIRTSHSGSQPQILGPEAAGMGGTAYQNHFQCIPSDVPFHPAPATPKPVIHGPQTAMVVGPAGEEIYTDEYGRVKVQFHWDRDGEENEKSSCWVRVKQAWAGANWGALFLPRIGHEVVVEFMEGDPDRPLVTGSVYNGENKPPYPLPDEKTKSTIKSNTSKGGGSANELLMEDNQGKTQVVLSNAYGHKITEDEETQTLTVETRDQNLVKFDDKNKNIIVRTTNAHSILMDDENKKVVIHSTDGYTIELDDESEKMSARTKNGHILLLDDQNKKIEITTTNGHTTILDDENKKIGVTSADGHSITIDDDGQSITLEDSGGAHKFQIDIGGGKLVISTDSGDIELKAGGKISMEATDIEVAASNELKLSGGSKGIFDGGIESSVIGVTIKVEGSAMTEVKGGLVKIN